MCYSLDQWTAQTEDKISPLYLRDILSYDPETGFLYWKASPRERFRKYSAWKEWNSKWTGKRADTSNSHGYRRVKINGRMHGAHRVIWAIVEGSWPNGEIDHQDGDTGNNRIDNLRDVDRAGNAQNRRLNLNKSSTGYFGVRLERNRFAASIQVRGKVIRLGSFDRIEDAIAARKEAEKLYGFHPNHGRVS